MTREEEIAVWDRFYPAFSFEPNVFRYNWPIFAEPHPCVTFHVGRVYKEYDKDPERYAQLIEDLNSKTHDAFRRCVPPSEYVYALDWNHQCYRFYPHKAKASEGWAVDVFPNGDYYIFLDKEFQFGTLGQPWEDTICVFGQPLINAFNEKLPVLFDRAVRKNGEEVDPLHSITWKIEKDRCQDEAYVFSKTFLDETHVEITIVKENNRFRIKSLAEPSPSIDMNGLDAVSSRDDLEIALKIVNERCSLWDRRLD